MKKKDIDKIKERNDLTFSKFLPNYKKELERGNTNGISKKELIGVILEQDNCLMEFYDDILDFIIIRIVGFKYIFDSDYSDLIDLKQFKQYMTTLKTIHLSSPLQTEYYITQEKCNEHFYCMQWHLGAEFPIPKDPIEEISVEHIYDEEYHLRNFIKWRKDYKGFLEAFKEVYPEYINLIEEMENN